MPERPTRKFPSIPERARWFAERAGSLPDSGSISRLMDALQLAKETPSIIQDASNVLAEGISLLLKSGYRMEKQDQDKAILINSEGKRLEFKTEPPKKQKGIGTFGSLFSVKKLPRPWAILVVPINSDDVPDLDLSTAALVRWEEEESEEANLIEASLFSDQHNLLFSRITKPGIYQALALPKNSWLVNLIETLGLYWPWLRMEPSFNQKVSKGVPLLKRICQLILCNEDIEKISADKLIELGLGERPTVPPRLGGGNICDLCLDRLLDVNIKDGKVVTPPELKLWHLGLNGPRVVNFPQQPVLDPYPNPRWLSIGPYPGAGFWGIGRVTQVDIHPTDSNVLIAGTAGGGVWRTHDGGGYWWPLMQNEPTLTIGAVAFSPSNPHVLYAASGEDAGGYDPAWPGVGIYRSNNDGATWTLTSSVPSTRFSAIVVHPTQPDVVYAAGNRGLHKSVNGGLSWVTNPGINSLFDGRITDIVLAHNDPDRIYIGVWNDGVYRSSPRVFDPDVHRSTLRGQMTFPLQEFVRLDGSNQLPSGTEAGWIKLAIGRNGAHGSNFLAAKLGPDGKRIFTTIDGGNIWTEQAADIDVKPFDEWASVIAVDPQNERRLYAGYAGAVTLRRTDDGGVTWAGPFSGVHVDQQDLVFNGNNPNIIYLANDGGVYRSSNAGVNWDPFESTARNMRISQLYDIDISQRYTKIVACGAQDVGIFYRNYSGYWRNLSFGWDGTQVAIDQTDPAIIYFSSQNGISNSGKNEYGKDIGGLSRSINGGFTITALGTAGLNLTAGSPWVTILKLDPTDPIADPVSNRVMFVCGPRQLYRSTNSGSNWQRVDDSAGCPFNTEGIITALEFAPSDPSILYLGTNTGALYRATGGGTTAANWIRIDTAGTLANALFPNTQISGIGIDPTNANHVYVVFAGNGVSYTGRPNMILNPLGISHVFKTTDGGINWEDASGSFAPLLLPDVPTSAIAVDNLDSEVAYVGTDVGVYRTSDGGTSWTSFQDRLPRSPITELRLHRSGRLLFAATMGRGVYSRPI